MEIIEKANKMERIIIEEDDITIISFLDKNTITSYSFNQDETVINIGNKIYSYFDFLVPLPEKTLKLPKEGDYDVVLNLETNYKHYYQNGIQDLVMFFINNGEAAVAYDGKSILNILKDIKSIPRTFNIKTKEGIRTITLKFASLALVATLGLGIAIGGIAGININQNGMPLEISNTAYEDSKYRTDDITVDMVEKWYRDADLSEFEFNTLFNRRFLEQKLPIINSRENVQQNFIAQNKGITISVYGPEDSHYDNANGYVTIGSPIINIKDTIYGNGRQSDTYHDTLSHEGPPGGHQSQCGYKYPLIMEACAEINAHEFNGCPIDSYLGPVKSIMILAESIGSFPIDFYVLTGDDSYIRESVKPYLSGSEKKVFFKYLEHSPGYSSAEETTKICDRLDELTAKIHEKRTGLNLEDNPVISYIEEKGTRKEFHRSYFNLDTRENSYFVTDTHKEKDPRNNTIEGALNSGEVYASVDFRRELSYEDGRDKYFNTENGYTDDGFQIRSSLNNSSSNAPYEVYCDANGNKHYCFNDGGKYIDTTDERLLVDYEVKCGRRKYVETGEVANVTYNQLLKLLTNNEIVSGEYVVNIYASTSNNNYVAATLIYKTEYDLEEFLRQNVDYYVIRVVEDVVTFDSPPLTIIDDLDLSLYLSGEHIKRSGTF